VTVIQAAQTLGISASLVYALCGRGMIRHERHGVRRGTIRITAEALEEYRHSCTVAGASLPQPEIKPKKNFQHLKL
jgi:excisionase family DNA binding protein